MTRDEIQKKVQDILADSLGVDEDEVTPQAVLRDDLGAESIDYLDIQFRLEKAFGIKIEKGEMFNPELANDPNFVQGGNITAQGIAQLKSRIIQTHLVHVLMPESVRSDRNQWML